ncbi:hypothetical protein FRC20_003626 [Serendipita sp. 405]|nr:hypothetical protein FRC20_003626 [Serendipita sp. 405]
MADPFTIATTVPTLVLQVGKAVKQLTDLVERYSRASTTLISLWTECNVVRSALGNLERILSKEENSMRLDPVMVDDIDRAILSCAVSISELVKEIDSIGVQLTDTHGETKLKALTKWKILWKEDDMRRLLDRLRGHSTSLFSKLLACLL